MFLGYSPPVKLSNSLAKRKKVKLTDGNGSEVIDIKILIIIRTQFATFW